MCVGSGVHRLFEGQGQKEKKVHIQHVLATEKGTFAHVFATQEHSFACFANQEGTLARVWLPRGHLSTRLAPKRAP